MFNLPEDWKVNVLSHIFDELEITNILISINANFEKIQKPHDSIHEFLFLASLCLPHDKNWHQKSAFLGYYHWGTFYSAHRSFLEALAGHYNVAYSLLRNTLELVIRGALWECLAHKKFRDNADILSKPKKNKTLIAWLNDLIEHDTSIEDQLEKTSGAIFDKTAIIFEDSKFQKEFIYLPKFREIIEQLVIWNIFDPIHNPLELIYDKIYGELSKEVHVIPDKTDIGRRLLSGKDLFKVEVMPNELNAYLETLHKLVDINTVIELNILSDWIIQNRESQNKLIERLDILKNLELNFAYKKLYSLVENANSNNSNK